MRAELKKSDSRRFIYSIRDERGNVLYIGVTHDLSIRIPAHRNAKSPLGEAIRRYESEGRTLFFRIECETTKEYALETERAFIALHEKRKLLNVNKRTDKPSRKPDSILPRCNKRVAKWNAFLEATRLERKRKRESAKQAELVESPNS